MEVIDKKIPKVFISYSWDSEKHKEWVKNLVDALFKDGIDVILDQYELKAGREMNHFMEKSIKDSHFILLILTENYKLKSDNLQGGVGYEYSIIRKELYRSLKENNKFIPILRGKKAELSIPFFMDSLKYIDFRANKEYKNKYLELIKQIYSISDKPEIGMKPNFSKKKRNTNLSYLALFLFFALIITIYINSNSTNSIDKLNSEEQIQSSIIKELENSKSTYTGFIVPQHGIMSDEFCCLEDNIKIIPPTQELIDISKNTLTSSFGTTEMYNYFDDDKDGFVDEGISPGKHVEKIHIERKSNKYEIEVQLSKKSTYRDFEIQNSKELIDFDSVINFNLSAGETISWNDDLQYYLFKGSFSNNSFYPYFRLKLNYNDSKFEYSEILKLIDMN